MNSDNDTEMMSSQAGNDTITPGPELLYGSAVRLAIAEDIVRDICNMIPVIVISGEKGEGKSTLCRMAVEEIPSDWLTIVFDRNVESFEDVVREVARTIGCGEVDVSRSGMNSSIEIIGERLQQVGKQVVTVFDEGEKIYLATLERIRKMLDQLNLEGVKMQVILCGRPLLLENLKQLSIVQFREVPEKRYVVKPLSVEDTGTYIDFLAHNPSSGVSGSYLPAAIQQIHDITGGNMNKIYDCAVRISCSDDRDAALAEMAAKTTKKKKSFDVAATFQRYARLLQGSVLGIIDRLKSLSRRDQMIGGGVCVALLVVVLLFSSGEKRESGSVGEAEPEMVEQATAPVEEVAVAPAAEEARDSAPVKNVPEEAKATTSIESKEQQVVPADAEPVAQPVEPKQEVVTRSPAQPEATTADHSEDHQAGPVDAEPDALPEETKQEVVVQPPAQPEATKVQENIDSQVVPVGAETETLPEEPEQTVADSVAEAEPVIIQAPDTAAIEGPDIAETDTVSEPLPEPNEDISAISTVEEEQASQVTGGEAPLIAPTTYKQIVDEALQPAEVTEQQDSESNIVISTLAESEKREIEVITSTPYKVLKPIEPLTEPTIVKTAELERVSPEPVAEDPFGEATGEVVVQQEEPVEEKIKKPILSQAIVVEGETAPPIAENTEAAVEAPEAEFTLLENRMEAGFPWLAGRRNGSYTMQLMMLSSNDAEAKIKGILSQREYKRASDKFYIFRKNSSPPVYFVFYGEYGNVTEARKARNEIPVFLRNHRPYVLSVPSAMRKVKY